MEPTKAEKIIMDYTASTKWEQIEKIHWTTAEVMDVFDTYFIAKERYDIVINSKSLTPKRCQGCKTDYDSCDIRALCSQKMRDDIRRQKTLAHNRS